MVTGIDLDRDSMKHIYEKFGLESGTQDFIGHAMALYLDDEYVSFKYSFKSLLLRANVYLHYIAISLNLHD